MGAMTIISVARLWPKTSTPDIAYTGTMVSAGFLLKNATYLTSSMTDGSPAGSTLIKGNGSGNPDLDQSREAIYGDADVSPVVQTFSDSYI